MRTKQFLPLLLIGITGFLSPGTAWGVSAEDSTPLLTRFDIEFPGGTVGDLVATMEEELGTQLNIVMDKVAAQTACPPLKLRSVSAFSLISSLEGILIGSDSEYDLHGGCFTDPSEADAIVFISCTPKEDRARRGILTQVRSINLHLKEYTLDDIVAAIRAALEMAGVGEKITFKFHEDTKLLMVQCRDEMEVMLLNEVLDELLN